MTVRGSIRDLSRYLKINISMLVGKSTYSYRNKYNNKSAAVGSSEQCTTVSLRSINERELTYIIPVVHLSGVESDDVAHGEQMKTDQHHLFAVATLDLSHC